MTKPTPEQRAEMAAYIDAKQPGLLDDLDIPREEPPVIIKRWLPGDPT